MHMTRRAPELSATSKLVCIWIMRLPSFFLYAALKASSSQNLFLLLAPDDGPALELRDRTMLLDPDEIAHRIFVGLVMRVELRRAAHGLLQDRMREAPLDAHDHRLVLFVAHHDALQSTLRHQIFLTSTSLWTSRT